MKYLKIECFVEEFSLKFLNLATKEQEVEQNNSSKFLL